MDNITFKEIQFNTKEYLDTVELRRDILRRPLGIDFTKEQLMSEFRDHHIAGFDEEGNVVACLILSVMDAMSYKMRQVAVDKSLQGKGIGKQLVLFSEKFALKKRKMNMVLSARETAIPFYLSLGYEIISEEFLEVGIPHKKMFKQLIG